MSNRKLILLLSSLIASISISGCKVKFAHTPSPSKISNKLNIEGEYEILKFPFQEKGEGIPKQAIGKIKISKNDDMNLPYFITLELGGRKNEEFTCQTYRIGELDIAFVKFKSKNAPTKLWFAFLIKVAKNQIEATPVNIEFFRQNSGKLKRKNSSTDKSISIDSESKMLDSFFETHQDPKALFDHENQMILKRTDKK